MNTFNVICERNSKFIPYDVMPYFRNEYKSDNKKPKTRLEFREFVKFKSMCHFWARCEYEIIISDWPGQRKQEKWDIHKQIMMNIDIIARLLREDVFKYKLYD